MPSNVFKVDKTAEIAHKYYAPKVIASDDDSNFRGDIKAILSQINQIFY